MGSQVGQANGVGRVFAVTVINIEED